MEILISGRDDMMNDLLKQISWDEPKYIQESAIKVLKNEKDLSIFMQPISENTGKKVWDNCALILCSKTDEELIPFMESLLEWLQDMNWPGAWEILERVQKIPLEKFEKEYDKVLKRAQQELEDIDEEIYLNSWFSNLQMIKTKLKKKDFFDCD